MDVLFLSSASVFLFNFLHAFLQVLWFHLLFLYLQRLYVYLFFVSYCCWFFFFSGCSICSHCLSCECHLCASSQCTMLIALMHKVQLSIRFPFSSHFWWTFSWLLHTYAIPWQQSISSALFVLCWNDFCHIKCIKSINFLLAYMHMCTCTMHITFL